MSICKASETDCTPMECEETYFWPEIMEFSSEVYQYVHNKILRCGYGLSCRDCKCTAGMEGFVYCYLCQSQFDFINSQVARYVSEFKEPLDKAMSTVLYYYDNGGPVSSV